MTTGDVYGRGYCGGGGGGGGGGGSIGLSKCKLVDVLVLLLYGGVVVLLVML